MIFAGVDEAALGPVLGPFCACCVVISSGRHKEFPGTIEDKSTGLYFTDSKKVYSKAKGIRLLEQNVLAAVKHVTGSFPRTAGEFADKIAPFYNGWKSADWLKGFGGIEIPRKADTQKIDEAAGLLDTYFAYDGFALRGIKALAVSAAEFNKSLDITGNKADTVRELMKPLFKGLSAGSEDHINIITDCQGGRRYYLGWLDKVFPGISFTEKVSETVSSYSSERISISFEIKADTKYLPVAMASMIAKYIRELFMEQFNSYWTGKIPGLAPTAGYPQDGKRFIEELNKYKLIPENRDRLVRKK